MAWIFFFFFLLKEFSCDAVGEGSSIVTAIARFTDVEVVQSLALVLPHAAGTTKK